MPHTLPSCPIVLVATSTVVLLVAAIKVMMGMNVMEDASKVKMEDAMAT